MNSIKTKSIRPRLHGIFSMSIPYEIRNTTGDWSLWFGEWEAQRKGWFDTQSCWSYAANEVCEDQLEFLMKTNRFSKTDIKWFQDNGYIDSDGDFYLSRRFIPILSGVRDTGNDESEFWRLTKKYGAIPSAMLPFTTQEEYFDTSKITPAMYALGKEFLKRVDIRYEELGKRFTRKAPELIKTALFQTELQIGVPVPQYTSWNQTKIKYEGDPTPAHSVALYKYDESDPEYPYFVYDQYEPKLKQLSKDYFITLCTKAVINPKNPFAVNTVPQTSWGALIWRAIASYFGFEVRDTQVST